jgi:hypothetical protein
MVEYYNMSGYSETTDLVGVLATTDTILSGYFSLFLIVMVGIIIAYIRLTRNDTPTNSVLIASFFSLLFSIFLYISEIMANTPKVGLKIFLPAIILVVTSIIKWYETKN